MRDADLLPAVTAIRDGGWGERNLSFDFSLKHPHCYPFVAEDDGEIVGTSIATQNGPVGWVGLVFVSPAMRGRGLGGELTSAAQRCLVDLGCRSVVLAATKLGRPVYDRLGFRTDGEYLIFNGPARSEPPHDPRLRGMTPADLPAVCALDARASGEDRAHLIDARAEGWVLDAGGAIRGYALRTPFGLGPAIAPDPEDGKVLIELLRSQSGGSGARLSPIDANHAAVAYLRDIGFAEQDHVVRMVLGEPVAWQPTHVWSIFSFALG